MKSTPPAMAPGTLTQLARGKTRRVQNKLKVAENELREANSTLVEALPEEVSPEVDAALQQASAAEHKVREAEQELEVVTKLLTVEGAALDGNDAPVAPMAGSGQGARSLLPHIGTPDRA